MQYELLTYLRCPLSKTALRLEVISEFNKGYDDGDATEISEGLLHSVSGMVFPIVDGIPRMQIEASTDHAAFMEKHLPALALREIDRLHGSLVREAAARNKRSKESFALEWSLLDTEERDRLWHQDLSGLLDTFLSEMGAPATCFRDQAVIDVGCGHGLMTSRIAGVAGLAIGVEFSRAVETAYQRNRCRNAWYVQADLQNLPFGENSFDALYSSGVIHHTPDTERSFRMIEGLVRKGGRISLWLYHPRKSLLHRISLSAREVTKRLPLRLSYALLRYLVLPVTYTAKKIKGGASPNWREEMIDLMDHFTPEFRFEIREDEARRWLESAGYMDIAVTTSNSFGFSIAGIKGDTGRI